MPTSKTLIVFIFSVLATISHWGLWTDPITVLGYNHTLFWIGLWILLLSSCKFEVTRDDLIWFLPLWLIGLSFSIWENPWTTWISFIFLPIAVAIVFSFRRLANPDGIRWNSEVLLLLTSRATKPLSHVSDGAAAHTDLLRSLSRSETSNIVDRLATGFLLLIPLSCMAIFLLSSVDQNFAILANMAWSWLANQFEVSLFMKLAMSIILSLLLCSLLIAWCSTVENKNLLNNEDSNVDPIVSSVVLSGLLFIYAAFIWLQKEVLAITTLPPDFSSAELIVKTGFWQLFILSILNVILFYRVFRADSGFIKWLILVFVIASGLILVSGAWRLGLYVYWYGLSYEKFFASYTAAFSLLVFCFLLKAAFSMIRYDVLKTTFLSALWFYAVATLLPIEKIILQTNLKLATVKNSRVNLFHLSALSSDVLHDIDQLIDFGQLEQQEWHSWLVAQQEIYCSDKWYEANLSRVYNCKIN